jgi:hypothetical protein
MAVPPSNDEDKRRTAHYQEFHYPYVLPGDDIVANVGDGILDHLTPLERVFVLWFVRCDDPTEAVQKLMRPSRPFDETVSNGLEIRLRPTVSEAVNKIRKKFPYLSKYTADYTLGIIHEEIEWLRARARRKRYDSDPAFLSRMCNGKNSVHSEEIEDTRLLIELLKLTQQLTSIQAADGSNLPTTTPGESHSRVDRVLAQAEEQILGRKTGDPRPPGGNTA